MGIDKIIEIPLRTVTDKRMDNADLRRIISLWRHGQDFDPELEAKIAAWAKRELRVRSAWERTDEAVMLRK
jgi:hypothetical protein